MDPKKVQQTIREQLERMKREGVGKQIARKIRIINKRKRGK